MSLLGDKRVKLLLRNGSIAVQISPLDHLLKRIIISEFSEVLGDFPQILEFDEACIGVLVPVFWESKVMKTLWTSALVSLSLGRVVIM